MSHETYTDPLGHHTLNVIAKAEQFNRWMYETIKPYLKGKVLEIGSGIGNISKFVLEDGFALTLSDYDAGYCQQLQQRFGHFANAEGIVSIDLQHETFYEQYSMLKQAFDTVFLLNVLEHLADDEKAIAYCQYLLKSSGNLIILVPAYPFLYNNLDVHLSHYKRYTLRNLITLLRQQKMVLIHKQYFNALGIAGWVLYGKLLGRKALQETEMSAYNSVVRLAKLLDRVSGSKIGLSIIAVAQK